MPAGLGQGRFQDVDTDPVIIDGKLIVGSYASGLMAMDPATGKPLAAAGERHQPHHWR